MKTALLLPLLINGVAAFAPVPSGPRPVTKLNQMFDSAAALEVADEEGTATDAFDAYKPDGSQKEIATRDVTIGSGYTVGDDPNQTLQISFKARFVPGSTEARKRTSYIKDFDVESMVFKTGEQRCLPGLEEGLKGMQVDGVRRVRVPPNRGYGNDWYRGIVPPNSHLEFDVTVMKVAQSFGEESMMKLEQFGIGRAAGGAACFLYLAISPLFEGGVIPTPHF